MPTEHDNQRQTMDIMESSQGGAVDQMEVSEEIATPALILESESFTTSSSCKLLTTLKFKD